MAEGTRNMRIFHLILRSDFDIFLRFKFRKGRDSIQIHRDRYKTKEERNLRNHHIVFAK